MARVTLRLFASARLAARTGRDEVEARSVGAALEVAVQRYGTGFADVLAQCKVWRNGEPASREDTLSDGDEVAVLPPVSGG